MQSDGKILFSIRLTPEESALLLALRRHLETQEGRALPQSAVIRKALAALVSVETGNGFRA